MWPLKLKWGSVDPDRCLKVLDFLVLSHRPTEVDALNLRLLSVSMVWLCSEFSHDSLAMDNQRGMNLRRRPTCTSWSFHRHRCPAPAAELVGCNSCLFSITWTTRRILISASICCRFWGKGGKRDDSELTLFSVSFEKMQTACSFCTMLPRHAWIP